MPITFGPGRSHAINEPQPYYGGQGGGINYTGGSATRDPFNPTQPRNPGGSQSEAGEPEGGPALPTSPEIDWSDKCIEGNFDFGDGFSAYDELVKAAEERENAPQGPGGGAGEDDPEGPVDEDGESVPRRDAYTDPTDWRSASQNVGRDLGSFFTDGFTPNDYALIGGSVIDLEDQDFVVGGQVGSDDGGGGDGGGYTGDPGADREDENQQGSDDTGPADNDDGYGGPGNDDDDTSDEDEF